MNKAVEEMQEAASKAVAQVLASENITPPCCAGCFWCCKEPLWASSLEVANAIESLGPEDRRDVAAQCFTWAERFFKSGFRSVPMVNAATYRAQNLWCPMLGRDGRCRCYSHRPLACRVHIAHGSNEACRDESKREQGKFAEFPGMVEILMANFIHGMPEGETMASDHFGVLLHAALNGVEMETIDRVNIWRKGNDICMQSHDESDRERDRINDEKAAQIAAMQKEVAP